MRFLIRVLHEAARGERPRVTLCPLAPLTNIALALIQAPDIVNGIERIVLMAGPLPNRATPRPVPSSISFPTPMPRRWFFPVERPL